jgi:hypothetical protein
MKMGDVTIFSQFKESVPSPCQWMSAIGSTGEIAQVALLILGKMQEQTMSPLVVPDYVNLKINWRVVVGILISFVALWSI